MATAMFHLILLLTAVHCCRAQSASVSLQETLNCTGNGVNSVMSQRSNLDYNFEPISSIFNPLAEYRTFSRIVCAFICNNYQTGDCAAVTFDEVDNNCKLYSQKSQTSVTGTLADPVLQYCWNKIFNLLPLSSPSLSTITTTTTTKTTTTSAASRQPANNPSCWPSYSLSSYVRPNSIGCPALSHCVCDYIVNVLPLTGININECFTKCSNNPNCLAFSYFPNVCYVDTTTSGAKLIYSRDTFTCYCNKSATTTVATKTVTINGVSYANLSCHPQKLFAESSYVPKFPIAGKQVDCRCEGGLYIQNGAYVNRSGTTFADCFSACEKIASPPCKAFAFIEANNTCVIAPTSNNGDSNDKRVLQCYTL